MKDQKEKGDKAAQKEIEKQQRAVQDA